MSARDHARYQDDTGAYLLGALPDPERKAFERHLAGCEECQEEIARLTPAVELIPSSVEQLEPPQGLRTAIMAEVWRDAGSGAAERRPEPSRGWFASRLRPLTAVAAVVLLGLAVAVGVTQLGDDPARTVAATVAEGMPEAGGTLSIEDGEGTLELHDMPDLGGTRVYQVWVQHEDRMVPAQTFEAGGDGTSVVELSDLGQADGVFVTREARGGAQVPSEEPIVSVPL